MKNNNVPESIFVDNENWGLNDHTYLRTRKRTGHSKEAKFIFAFIVLLVLVAFAWLAVNKDCIRNGGAVFNDSSDTACINK